MYAVSTHSSISQHARAGSPPLPLSSYLIRPFCAASLRWIVRCSAHESVRNLALKVSYMGAVCIGVGTDVWCRSH